MEPNFVELQKSLGVNLRDKRIFVACSGGIDSMVLLHCLASQKARMGFDLRVLHVNYGLRGAESDGDQELVEEFTANLGVPIKILDLKRLEKPQNGIQQWARQKRMEWMASMAEAPNDLVALGHHADDLAENLLFRLARGTHRTLGGIQQFQGKFWRPFLSLGRGKIAAYAAGQNVPFREDSSNAKLLYSRNRIRHKVLPQLEELFPGAGGRMADTAGDLDQVLAYLDRTLEHLSTGEHLRWEQIGSLPEAVGRRVISAFLRRQHCLADRHQLRQVWWGLSTGATKTVELMGNLSVFLEKGTLQLGRKPCSTGRSQQYQKHLRVEGIAVVPPGGQVEIMQTGGAYLLTNEGERGYKSVIVAT